MTKELLLELLYSAPRLSHAPVHIEYDDIIQSIAEVILRKDQAEIDTIATIEQAHVYINVMSRMIITAERRKQSKHYINFAPPDALVIDPFNSSDTMYGEMREVRERVVRFALNRIPARHRQILEFFGNGMTIAQYAKIQLMTYNAALQLHHRAKKSLRLELEKLQVPESLWRLGESDKMSPDLLQWLVEGSHSAEILCTAIASDVSPSAPSTSEHDDLPALLVDSEESIDHSSDEIDRQSMVLQNGEQYEDDPF